MFSFDLFVFSRILVRDLVYIPLWSSASKSGDHSEENSTLDAAVLPTHTRESLSNILLTHIDFRRPILDSKRYNTSRHDETIEKVPESCIEEFYLYVSTWKGWHGPLPGKDNRVTWEQVERANVVEGVASCTHLVQNFHEDIEDELENSTNTTTSRPTESIAESFRYCPRDPRCFTRLDRCPLASYSMSKVPKSNLMMIYVNRPKAKSSLCPKLIIKRKPVEFTPEEWCTRLRTTPYRERPHKCFFVHDGENKTLFPKCANSSRPTSSSSSVVFLVLVFILQRMCT